MAVDALYPGTFDPFTKGHQDIVLRALQLFNSLTIVVAVPSEKTPFLSSEDRVEMIAQIFKNESRVKAVRWDGLIVDFARNHRIGVIVRGLRPTGDFDNEFQMATMNRNLNPEVETIFITTSGQSYYVSSSIVREIFLHGGDVKHLVPKVVYQAISKHRQQKG